MDLLGYFFLDQFFWSIFFQKTGSKTSLITPFKQPMGKSLNGFHLGLNVRSMKEDTVVN